MSTLRTSKRVSGTVNPSADATCSHSLTAAGYGFEQPQTMRLIPAPGWQPSL